ncbi:MAG: ABC transporter permease [Candidatus Omnitrophica bacterium]|nr:ABC transporter permease [Candidatus Omnitrophota bacterium]MCF7877464.1 ABC transporter permease [Candidatus Omnitrophota bacterium]MCF7878639.1 ABC transporter permease [Candidatus Omnitrophota bacterium]MCF7892814.1 ABC transporter permease [Candidatus Omnitrophota bacterium]
MLTEIFLAFRYLFRGQARHLSFIGIMSVTGIILGVATVIVAVSIVNGIDGSLIQRIMKFRYHITLDSAEEDVLSDLKGKMEEKKEVEDASLSIRTQIFAKFDDTIIPLVVRGFELGQNRGENFFSQYIEEEFTDSGFFIGKGLQRRFYLDDSIEFYPLKKRLSLEKGRIRGYFETGLYDVDNYYAVTDLEKAKNLSPNYHLFLGLRIAEPFEADKLAKRISKNNPEVTISTWTGSNQELFATLRLEKIALFIILTLIIVIASFNIFATLTVKVVEKTKDIGVLKSIGFTSRKILSVFTLQGLILGIIGALSGAALGLGSCYLLKKYPFIKLPEEIFFTEYLPISVDLKEVLIISLVAVFISFLSSIWPALRACRLCPTEALRYE